MAALFAGNLLVVGLAPLRSATAGASGAILGTAGMLIVYFYFQRRVFDTRQMLNSLVRMVLINLLIGLLPGVSLWGHLGGVIGGVLSGLILYPRYRVRQEEASVIGLEVLPLRGQQWALLLALGLGMMASLQLILILR